MSGSKLEGDEELKSSQFYWDATHPWDRTGHRHVIGRHTVVPCPLGFKVAALLVLTAAPLSSRCLHAGR